MAAADANLATQVARVLRRIAEVAKETPSGALGRESRLVAGLTPERLATRSERLILEEVAAAEKEATGAFRKVDATLRLALRSNHASELFFSLGNAFSMLKKASFARGLSLEDRMAMIADLAEKMRPLSREAHLNPGNLLKEAAQRGYAVNVAGSIRELYGRNLSQIQLATRDYLVRIAEARRTRPALEVVDSRILGSVELPTRLRKGERTVRLGSDRIVASGLRQPQVVSDVDDAGHKFEVVVTGVLPELHVVAEVKGRTTAPGALDQFVKLNQRGSGGYVVIGDSLWLMPRFDPSQARFFAVAPVGPMLATAEKEAKLLRSLGYGIEVLAIDAAVDEEILAVSRELVEGYVALSKSLVY
jgi:hypothetical protein